jgi:DNA-binding IclR family transcriptional regulator
VKQVRSLVRAIRILESFQVGEGRSFSDISQEMEIPKSTVYEILTTLAEQGVLQRDETGSRFQLGIKLIELGSRARYNFALNRVAAAPLKALSEKFNETVYLTVRDGDQVFYVDCYESTRALRTFTTIGDRAPLYCTAVGKAILAFQPVEEIRRILHASPLIRYTQNTIIDEVELLEELHRIAARGYSVDDMEHEAGVRCVGAPVRDAEDRVFAAISVSGPEQRVTPQREAEIAQRVISTAGQISSSLGYRSPGPVASGSEQGYRDRKEVNTGERQQPTILN